MKTMTFHALLATLSTSILLTGCDNKQSNASTKPKPVTNKTSIDKLNLKMRAATAYMYVYARHNMAKRSALSSCRKVLPRTFSAIKYVVASDLNLGELYEKRGDWEKSDRYYKKAIFGAIHANDLLARSKCTDEALLGKQIESQAKAIYKLYRPQLVANQRCRKLKRRLARMVASKKQHTPEFSSVSKTARVNCNVVAVK